MSRHVPDERLDVIHAQFSGAIRQKGPVWVEVEGVPVVPGHDLICLLDELRMRRGSASRTGKSQFRIGHTTSVLMAMKIGESVEVEPITKGAMTCARRTARKHMGNPYAVWWTQTQEDGLVRVTRAPDGSPPHAKYHNPAVYELAAMRLGETRILTTLKGKMHNGIKVHARKVMDDAGAQWRCLNLANGDVRCERTR